MTHPELAGDPRYHQCALLEYDCRYLELAHADSPYQRWVLRSLARATVSQSSDPVLLQVCLFCPMCGFDGRKDARWRIPGKPEFNELLLDACQTGAALSEARFHRWLDAHSLDDTDLNDPPAEP